MTAVDSEVYGLYCATRTLFLEDTMLLSFMLGGNRDLRGRHIKTLAHKTKAICMTRHHWE